jgi:hypothetical protein
MERRLNKKLEAYITSLKEDMNKKAAEIFGATTPQTNVFQQFVYDYDRLVYGKEDFQKRKRVKNVVPLNERCCAKRASNEQCTRRKKDGIEYCGTHMKGTPHGIIHMDDDDNSKVTTQKVEVWAQDIKGIIYYIDKQNNVYQAEDVVVNKVNPKVIAKYLKIGEQYSIPAFNI